MSGQERLLAVVAGMLRWCGSLVRAALRSSGCCPSHDFLPVKTAALVTRLAVGSQGKVAQPPEYPLLQCVVCSVLCVVYCDPCAVTPGDT